MQFRTLLPCLVPLACSDQSVKVLEEEFTVTITDPVDGTTVASGQSRTARARVESAQHATGDIDTIWLLNGEELCTATPVDADGLSTCEFDPPSGMFDLATEAIAPTAELATDSVRLEGTTPDPDDPSEPDRPTVPTVSISPNPAYTADPLVAEASGSEMIDGSTVSYRYAWTVDGTTHGGDAATVDAAHTARDQTWVVSVTPSANGIDGPAGTASVSIRNTAPETPALTILPAAPSAGTDAIKCVVEAASIDADTDPVTYRMAWTVDGTAVASSDDTGTGRDTTTTTAWPDDTIPATLLTAGEWTCTAEPHDGTDVGAIASATVTVTESFPSDCPDGNCSLEFDGINDFVEVPHDSTLDVATTGLTVEAWLFYSSLDTDCMVGVRKGTSASASFAYWLHKNGAPVDSLYWGSWPAYTCLSWSAVQAGQWVHYAGVWDPSTNRARTYVNGVEFCDEALTSPIQNNSEPLRIGIDWDWGCPMHGLIDEVRISSVARYNGTFTPSTGHTPDADTMALYSFDAYSGPTLYDRSGNGNHGVIDGAVWSTSSPP